jgi:hypothetical protein
MRGANERNKRNLEERKREQMGIGSEKKMSWRKWEEGYEMI